MVESLKDVVKRAHGMAATKALPVTAEEKVFEPYVLPRHDAWMSRPESERVWSSLAVEFAHQAFIGAFKKPRPGRISPSAMGETCERALLFGFAGAPQLPFPKANAEKMVAGDFYGLRWQMEGISAGYMLPPPGQRFAGEIWVHSESLRCGGSADARLADGSLYEGKSTASHLFKVAQELAKPRDKQRPERFTAWDYFNGMHIKHKLQMEAYWLVDEVSAAENGTEPIFNGYGSLLYQNADNPAQLQEFRLHTSPSRREEVHRILEGVHDWIDLNELPDLLPGCARHFAGERVDDKELRVVNGCPYREHCPTAPDVVVGADG